MSVTPTALRPDPTLPAASRGRSTAWWGMAMMIATEGTIFLVLVASYFFLWASAPEWPPPGVEAPELGLSVVFAVVLWLSSAPVFYAERAIRRGDRRGLMIGLALGFILGAAFVAHTAIEFEHLTFGWRDHAYGSAYYTIVGLHTVHLVVGLLMSLVVQLKAWLGRFSAERHVTVEVFGLYWHFVDLVWVLVFGSLFVAPNL